MRNHVFIASRRNARWIIVSVLILIMAGYARAQAPPAAQEKPQTEEQKKKAAVALDGREATKEVKQAAEATPGTKPQRAVVRAKQNEARKAETLEGAEEEGRWLRSPTASRPTSNRRWSGTR